jgi:ribosomal protein L7/L12
MDAAPLDAEPAIQAPDETAMPEGGELSAATEEAAAPAATEQRAPAGDLYNVFLSKITETSKRDKAAELIAKVKGCSTSEAKELTTRLVIPLAKNVSKEQAEEILNQFKKLKIFGRMTKVK